MEDTTILRLFLLTRPFEAGRSLAFGVGSPRCFAGVLLPMRTASYFRSRLARSRTAIRAPRSGAIVAETSLPLPLGCVPRQVEPCRPRTLI